MLRSDEEFAAEGAVGWAAAQGLLGGEAREIGIVILLREMREDEIARARVETLRIGEILADGMIR